MVVTANQLSVLTTSGDSQQQRSCLELDTPIIEMVESGTAKQSSDVVDVVYGSIILLGFADYLTIIYMRNVMICNHNWQTFPYPYFGGR